MNSRIDKVDFLKYLDRNINVLEELIYKVTGQEITLRNYNNKLDNDICKGIVKESDKDSLIRDYKLSKEFQDIRYESNLKSSDIIERVLFNELDYPSFVKRENGKPSIGKKALVGLIDIKGKSGIELKEDIIFAEVNSKLVVDAKYEDTVLVSAEQFNNCKYPVSLLLYKYKIQETLYLMLNSILDDSLNDIGSIIGDYKEE